MLDATTLELLPTNRELMDHNYWARGLQLRACAGLDQEQSERPLGGSFPSLRETFAHLVAVEWIRLERWRGESPTALIPLAELPTLVAVSNAVNGIPRIPTSPSPTQIFEMPS
jgi:hypothetical protein